MVMHFSSGSLNYSAGLDDASGLELKTRASFSPAAPQETNTNRWLGGHGPIL